MSTDTIRLHYTYIAGLLVLAGCFALVALKLDDIPGEVIVALVTGALGFVLGFIFNRESAVGAARAQERAVALGATTATPTVVQNADTVQGGDPTIVTNGKPK